MLWGLLFKFVIALAISYATRPRPPGQDDAKPQTQEAPDTQEGTPVPVVFGTVKMERSAVLWWGDLQKDPIYPDDEGGKKG